MTSGHTPATNKLRTTSTVILCCASLSRITLHVYSCESGVFVVTSFRQPRLLYDISVLCIFPGQFRSNLDLDCALPINIAD